jgi:hypothetical protein
MCTVSIKCLGNAGSWRIPDMVGNALQVPKQLEIRTALAHLVEAV